MPNSITMNQTYSNRWVIRQDKTEINSTPDKYNFNEFPTGELVPGKATVFFNGQHYADIGFIISLITILITTCLYFINIIKNKNKTI